MAVAQRKPSRLRSAAKPTSSLGNDSTRDASRSAYRRSSARQRTKSPSSSSFWRDGIDRRNRATQEFPDRQVDPNAVLIPLTSELDDDRDADYDTAIEDPEEYSEDEETSGNSVVGEDEGAQVRGRVLRGSLPGKRARTEFEQGRVSNIRKFFS